jgi:hypothetical protein
MPKERFSAEQIVTLLRQIEVAMAHENQADHGVRNRRPQPGRVTC